MLQVRENEISLRKLPGGTAQLRTLRGNTAHDHQCCSHNVASPWATWRESRTQSRRHGDALVG